MPVFITLKISCIYFSILSFLYIFLNFQIMLVELLTSILSYFLMKLPLTLRNTHFILPNSYRFQIQLQNLDQIRLLTSLIDFIRMSNAVIIYLQAWFQQYLNLGIFYNSIFICFQTYFLSLVQMNLGRQLKHIFYIYKRIFFMNQSKKVWRQDVYYYLLMIVETAEPIAQL